ncbi:MAG: Rieske 2Fe-2S domain-containing protein [Gammaproteobacteria bacterium]|nr:Rieske 2Fe-2S domain-containing protein [Gammaproteobacteria bacterium]
MTTPRYAFLQPGNYARGWHIVLFSQELAVGQVKRLHYFERELVAYRGESGNVGIVDAHCPHLGAHLASGEGRVLGDNIACPFHGWTFNAQGQCVDIPYASTIPDKAVNALGSWSVLEINGFIALWYDRADNPPENYLPRIDPWGESQWGDWQFYRSRIQAKACDVIENIVDVAHFPHVHGGIVRKFENRFGERTVTQLSTVDRDASARMIVPPNAGFDLQDMRDDQAGEDADAWGDATYHGPSIMYYYTESKSAEVSFRSWWVNCHTPVNDNELDLCSAVIFSSLDERPLPEEFTLMYPQMAHLAFGQDVEIWKDKIYRDNPILCDGDGPINKLRKWYEQFFLPPA